MGMPYISEHHHATSPSTRAEALAFVAQLEQLSVDGWMEVIGAYREAQGLQWRSAEEAVNSAIGRSRRMSAEGEVVIRAQSLAQAVSLAAASRGRSLGGTGQGAVFAAVSMAALALLTRDQINPRIVWTLLQPFACACEGGRGSCNRSNCALRTAAAD